MNVAPKSVSASIEIRSIDYVPDDERHGGLLSQFTLWLAANLQITAIVTGALAVVLGGDVFWSLIGLFAGQLIGGAIMALHAAQGPQLGLPQMISCRVQFGVYGAIIPMVAVCLMYIGFSASGCVLAGQALSQLLKVDEGVAIVLFSICIVVVTLFGYRFIHAIGRVASVVGVAAFSYMFYRLFAGHDVSALLANRHFSGSAFLLAMSLSASWQIAYGPYVADYSRYLPRNTSVPRVFAAVGLGSVIGSQISMSFGVLAAALAGNEFEHHEVAYIVGLGATGAAAMFRRSFVGAVAVEGQLFDEDFFAYREDADLAWRGQLMGWKCLYAPAAVAWHVRRVTPERREDLPLVINWHSVKNRFLMRGKNASGWLCWKLFWPVAWRDLMVLGYAIVRDRRLLSAISDPLRNIGSIRRKRKIIQARRRVPDRDLIWWFSDTPRAIDAGVAIEAVSVGASSVDNDLLAGDRS